MIKNRIGLIKNEGINYKVDISNGDLICFWTNAPKKITKLLLILWFTNVEGNGEYDIINDLFKEFGYVLKNYNEESDEYMHLNFNELIYQ